MNYISYITTPVIGAVIGYFTNWLAIKMLFRPHREKRIAGIKLPFTPGLIPKERERLTKKVAETVSSYVLTPEVLAKELSSANVWQWLDHTETIPDITVGTLLEKIGVSQDDLGVYAERAAMTALQDEKVIHTLTAFAVSAIRSALAYAEGNMDALRNFCVERLDTYLRGDDGMRLIADGLRVVRGYVFSEGATVGSLLPVSVVTAVKQAAEGLLPEVIARVKRWPEDNPQLDEKLEALVRHIIDENFGRFIGLFIDHKKIYTNIKDGLFTYLADSENQAFLTVKIQEGIDLFCATECTRWENSLPQDAYFIEKIAAWAESNSTARIVDPLFNTANGGWALTDLLDRFAPDFDEKIAAFCKTALPGSLSRVISPIVRQICRFRLRAAVHFFSGDEKKAALRRAFQQIAAYVAGHMNIREMIEEKINAFAVEEAESLILSVVNRELRAITALGGVLGFVIGMISLIPRFFTP